MIQPKRILLIAPCQMMASTSFEYAAQLAKGMSGTLRVVAFVGPGGRDEPDGGSASSGPLSTFQRWLNAEVGLLDREDLHVCAEVLWGQRSATGICRYVQETEADYLVKDMEQDLPARSSTLSTLDWQLLQESPVPVLLVKHHGDMPSRRIVAAVDILHCGPEVREMNRWVIEAGHMLAGSLGASLHVLSIYDRRILPVEQGNERRPASILSHQQARQRFTALADRSPTPVQNRHFIVNEAPSTIRDYVNRCAFDVLVLAARDYLSTDLLLGRTEHCLLGDPPCSVMVLKPRMIFDRSSSGALDSFMAAHVS